MFYNQLLLMMDQSISQILFYEKQNILNILLCIGLLTVFHWKHMFLVVHTNNLKYFLKNQNIQLNDKLNEKEELNKKLNNEYNLSKEFYDYRK